MDTPTASAAAPRPHLCPFLRQMPLAAASAIFNADGNSYDEANSSGTNGACPIFADTLDFNLAFKLFHGHNGMMPLDAAAAESSLSSAAAESPFTSFPQQAQVVEATAASESKGSAVPLGAAGVLNSTGAKQARCPFAAAAAAGAAASKASSTRPVAGAPSSQRDEQPAVASSEHEATPALSSALPAALAASAAAISLSPLGPSGPFGFDSFRSALDAQKKKKRAAEQQRKQQEQHEGKDGQERGGGEKSRDGKGRDDGQTSKNRNSRSEKSTNTSTHEAMGSEWLATGNCPIAKSYRAISRVLPPLAAAAARALDPSRSGLPIKYECPPAIVAMRAAAASLPAMKALRPQALPVRCLAIATMGLFLNVPLGMWREHLVKFSPQWILVVHASVPVVAVFRKAALMPKYAMAFTIAASIVGQAVGARLERKRIAAGSSAVPAAGASAAESSSAVAMVSAAAVPVQEQSGCEELVPAAKAESKLVAAVVAQPSIASDADVVSGEKDTEMSVQRVFRMTQEAAIATSTTVSNLEIDVEDGETPQSSEAGVGLSAALPSSAAPEPPAMEAFLPCSLSAAAAAATVHSRVAECEAVSVAA